MTQEVEYLPSKCEALSSSSRITHTQKISIKKRTVISSRESDHFRSFPFSILKNYWRTYTSSCDWKCEMPNYIPSKVGVRKNIQRLLSGREYCAHAHTHTHTHTHTHAKLIISRKVRT
jgi:hypothetical protein